MSGPGPGQRRARKYPVRPTFPRNPTWRKYVVLFCFLFSIRSPESAVPSLESYLSGAALVFQNAWQSHSSSHHMSILTGSSLISKSERERGDSVSYFAWRERHACQWQDCQLFSFDHAWRAARVLALKPLWLCQKASFPAFPLLLYSAEHQNRQLTKSGVCYQGELSTWPCRRYRISRPSVCCADRGNKRRSRAVFLQMHDLNPLALMNGELFCFTRTFFGLSQ